MIRAVARAARARWAVATKERRGDRTVRVCFDALPAGREAVLVDDIASTGATLAAAANALRRHGVRCNTVVAVHALFAPDALKRLHAAGLTTVVTMDTIAHPTNGIPCAPIIAAALAPLRPRSLDPSIP
jgi:ribose-phosphate pyrophosphokinase